MSHPKLYEEMLVGIYPWLAQDIVLAQKDLNTHANDGDLHHLPGCVSISVRKKQEHHFFIGYV